MRLDGRVPVRFGTMRDRTAEDAVLVEGDLDASPPVACFTVQQTAHAAGCACCVPRTGAGRALAALFAGRARSDQAYFKAVLAITRSDAGAAAVRVAVMSDPVASARFRLI